MKTKRILRDFSGVSLVIAIITLLILAVMAAVLFSFLAVESDISVSQNASAEAFYIADAGMEYAMQQLDDDWTGYAGENDKAFSAGEFDVSVYTTDTDGSPLPANRRRVSVVARVPATGTPLGERSIEAIVQR